MCAQIYEWWRNTPGAKNFLQEVAKTSRAGKSAIIDLPREDLNGFVRILSDFMSLQNLSPAINVFDSMEIEPLDVFDKIVDQFTTDYRQDFSSPPFLDLSKQNALDGRLIFIPISNSDRFASVVNDLNSVSRNSFGSIIFIAKHIRPNLQTQKILIKKFISPVDLQFFTIRLLQDSDLTPMQQWYTALVATKLAMEISISETLLQKLSRAELYFNGRRFAHESIGNSFDETDFDTMFDRIIWETQIQLILPIVERQREEIILRNEDFLRTLLPIRDEFGNEMWAPLDMEFRNLRYHAQAGFSPEDRDLIEMMYVVRNELSHLKILPLEKLEAVLKLTDSI